LAQARCHGCGAAAIIGGVAAGAIIGSAIANGGAAYAAPAPVVEDGPPPPAPGVYYDQADQPVCHVEERRVWVQGYGWQPRRMEVCN
jgi:hypothetical protein